MLFLSVVNPESTQSLNSKGLPVEMRLDLFPQINIEEIRGILKRSAYPVMLALRSTSQGGAFRGTEVERKALITQLLSLEPSFFDLEYDMDPNFIHEVKFNYPKTKFILSYHNFQETPTNLEEIYDFMQKYTVFGYKIAVMAHSANDALKLLLFARSRIDLSVISIGEKGTFARVLGPVVGNLIDYASTSPKKATGLGQLTVSELSDIYRYPCLNKETLIYGLIGDPVDKSPGHLYHNAIFRKERSNAVYVKMNVKPEELSEFIPFAVAIGIRGLSVTMPLKEKILPFLDEIDSAAQQIGAVNTLLFNRERIIGTNTDGLGALDAIEKRTSVRGKKIVLLGAGGVARGIAFEAKSRGADLFILNRNAHRAEKLAASLNCQAGGLSEVPKAYDILINCSPDSMPINPQAILPHTVAMDVVYSPRETPFLREAVAKSCQIIYGEEMFLNQAARQSAFWMNI